MTTSSPPSASSAAATAPPAPEPTTTASQATMASRTMSLRSKTLAGLAMAGPHDLLGARDVGGVALDSAARDLGDPGFGVELEARLDRRRVVVHEGEQRLQRLDDAIRRLE